MKQKIYIVSIFFLWVFSACTKPSEKVEGVYAGGFTIADILYTGSTTLGGVSDDYVTFIIDCPSCPMGSPYSDLSSSSTDNNVKVKQDGNVVTFLYSYSSGNGGDIVAISGNVVDNKLNYTFTYNYSYMAPVSGTFDGSK